MDLKETKAGMSFTDLIGKISNGETLSEEQKVELENAAIEIGAHYEKDGERSCYWVCETNHFSCNPNSPPPNCRCVRRCI